MVSVQLLQHWYMICLVEVFIELEGGGTHYFNKITGQYVDLTREQFDLYNIEVAYEPNETMQREYCCKNPDTNARYRQLQRNIIAYLKNNED